MIFQDKHDKSSADHLTSLATLASHVHVTSYGTSKTQFALIFLQRRGEFTDSLDAYKYHCTSDTPAQRHRVARAP